MGEWFFILWIFSAKLPLYEGCEAIGVSCQDFTWLGRAWTEEQCESRRLKAIEGFAKQEGVEIRDRGKCLKVYSWGDVER